MRESLNSKEAVTTLGGTASWVEAVNRVIAGVASATL